MKSGPKLPTWAVAASLAAFCVVIGLVLWKSLYPSDPALDGHGYKIFTPDEIGRFRAEAAKEPSAPRKFIPKR